MICSTQWPSGRSPIRCPPVMATASLYSSLVGDVDARRNALADGQRSRCESRCHRPDWQISWSCLVNGAAYPGHALPPICVKVLVERSGSRPSCSGSQCRPRHGSLRARGCWCCAGSRCRTRGCVLRRAHRLGLVVAHRHPARPDAGVMRAYASSGTPSLVRRLAMARAISAGVRSALARSSQSLPAWKGVGPTHRRGTVVKLAHHGWGAHRRASCTAPP